VDLAVGQHDLIWPLLDAGNMIWPLDNTIWPLGNTIWTLGNTIWTKFAWPCGWAGPAGSKSHNMHGSAAGRHFDMPVRLGDSARSMAG
jgi:hypothetical protein